MFAKRYSTTSPALQLFSDTLMAWFKWLDDDDDDDECRTHHQRTKTGGLANLLQEKNEKP
jgi:hypothetical protein